MSLVPPLKVGKLQETLHAKAKGLSKYRFYALYDKVYRADVLRHAYRICQFNGGAPGVDGQTFADIEKYGRQRWLDELTDARQRLRQWLRRKHQLQGWGYTRFPDEYLHGELGLVQLRVCDRNVPWATA